MEKTEISVIVPVYNTEPYLHQCLDSLVNQTLKEIEIICVDDGSTDNSLQILNEYAQRDSRITVLTQNHQYAGVARNKGMELAKGEYLSFLDSDDFFEPTFLEEMYKAAQKDDTDVTICDAKVYADGNLREDKVIITDSIPQGIFSCKNTQFANNIFQCMMGTPWNKLFKTSFVRKQNMFFSSTLHHNDVAFVMGNIVAAHKLVYIPQHLIYWRYKPNSLCHNPTISDSAYRSINDLHNYISKSDNYPLVEHSFINFIIDYTTSLYNFCQKEDFKLLSVAIIKAFYHEYNIEKYPEHYFYRPMAYQQFMLLARTNILPVGI